MLAKSRTAINNKLAEQAGRPIKQSKKSGKRTKIGKRKDLGLFLRSGWEANFLRWLKLHKYIVQYEPTTFSFIPFGIFRGTVSYTPDFFISDPLNNKITMWIEVKGFMKPSDKTRIRRFKKYYPQEFSKLQVVTGSSKTAATKFFQSMGVKVFKYYDELKKEKDLVPNWEN